jgi:hypothetical protein
MSDNIVLNPSNNNAENMNNNNNSNVAVDINNLNNPNNNNANPNNNNLPSNSNDIIIQTIWGQTIRINMMKLIKGIFLFIVISVVIWMTLNFLQTALIKNRTPTKFHASDVQ